jgi:hypothetical protein
VAHPLPSPTESNLAREILGSLQVNHVSLLHRRTVIVGQLLRIIQHSIKQLPLRNIPGPPGRSFLTGLFPLSTRVRVTDIWPLLQAT